MNNPFIERKTIVNTIKTLVHTKDSIENIEAKYEKLTCKDCGYVAMREELKNNLYVCPSCGRYGRLSAATRIRFTADHGTFREINRGIRPFNPLDFPGYDEKLLSEQKKTHLRDAVLTGTCKIGGNRVVLCAMDSYFMMGSMGVAVGEKLTRACEYATEKKLPIIVFSTSGGARMQEGMLSLMQMAKTSAAFARHSESGLLYISVLTHPTTGGVFASFASLGDIQLAEPDALIGFAGPRVIEDTIGESLPEGFQLADFQQEHGFIDRVVERKDMRETLIQLLRLHMKGKLKPNGGSNLSWKIPSKKSKLQKYQTQNFLPPEAAEASSTRSTADRVKIARSTDRPSARDYITSLFTDFIELKGDRLAGEDASILAGIASFHGLPVTVIGQQKGRTLQENLTCRFGMPNPEGYRKAHRLMIQAEKFNRPLITFIDTPGAYPGKEAEEHGQGPAIAECIKAMSRLKIPTIAVFIGEGGSGGALALSTSDRIIMLENSVFSILSPEGFASILWKDKDRWEEAAEDMKMTASDLYDLGICDRIIREPSVPLDSVNSVLVDLDAAIISELQSLLPLRSRDLITRRYRKLRAVGKSYLQKGKQLCQD